MVMLRDHLFISLLSLHKQNRNKKGGRQKLEKSELTDFREQSKKRAARSAGTSARMRRGSNTLLHQNCRGSKNSDTNIHTTFLMIFDILKSGSNISQTIATK